MPLNRRRDILKNTIINKNIANVTNKYTKTEQEILQALVEERNKIHKTELVLQAGVLTAITYFSQVVENSGDMINIQGANKLSKNIVSYHKINKLEVKFLSAIEIEDESSEIGKSYSHEGTLQILPNTIEPKENDYFCIYFIDSYKLYRITKVNIDSLQDKTAITVNFSLADDGENFIYDEWILKPNVIKEFDFVREYLGTGYRTVLEPTAHNFINNMRDLYQYLGINYCNYFLDTDHFLYVLRSSHYFNFDKVEYSKKDDIIIDVNGQEYNLTVPEEFYDEELAYFIRSNLIFKNIGSYVMFVPNDFLPWNELHYSNTIFKAIELQDPIRFYNTKMTAKKITYTSQQYPPCLFGRYIISHVRDAAENEERKFLNTTLKDVIFGTTKPIPFDDQIHSSFSNLMAETIGLYIRKDNMDEICKRLEYLWANKHHLHVDPEGIYPNNAYYLFPMIAYIINKAMEYKLSSFNI